MGAVVDGEQRGLGPAEARDGLREAVLGGGDDVELHDLTVAFVFGKFGGEAAFAGVGGGVAGGRAVSDHDFVGPHAVAVGVVEAVEDLHGGEGRGGKNACGNFYRVLAFRHGGAVAEVVELRRGLVGGGGVAFAGRAEVGGGVIQNELAML